MICHSAWYDARTDGLLESRNTPDFIDPAYDPFIGLQGLNGTLQRALDLSGINGGVNHPQRVVGTPNADDQVYMIRMKDDGGVMELTYTADGIGGASNADGKHSIEPATRSHLDMEHIAGAPAGEAGHLFDGAPGFVTQGDLLAMIGPALTARGDTFLIRTYGDEVDTAGNVIATARLEAVVQRTVEPVTPADPAADLDDPERFRPTDLAGRKFKIVGLRWIDENQF